ncbi:MAG: thioredoxin family protein [Acidobacteria bacterium]|nr:thioredoxin family protein [Acidobacteriota bacterium]
MRTRVALTAACTTLLVLYSAALTASPASPQTSYVAVTEFDPARDAATDVQRALVEAKRTERNVLLDVGGKWCIWCRFMDEFFEADPAILKLREDNYVTVKVNFSPENKNEELLSRYPEIPGYPHLFVLDAQGQLLHSQSTEELEAGKSYDVERFTAFLKKWSPARPAK